LRSSTGSGATSLQWILDQIRGWRLLLSRSREIPGSDLSLLEDKKAKKLRMSGSCGWSGSGIWMEALINPWWIRA
jgi:hypothetical protein